MLNFRRILQVVCLCLGGWRFNVLADSAPVPGAEPAYIIKRVEDEKWLSDSVVIAMTQTRDGYLWLGTLNGLARFDGVQCTVFSEANTPELKSSPIVCLFEDSRSNLWVGTLNAGSVLIRRDGTVQPVKFPGGRDGQLVSLSEDAGGTVWLNREDGLVASHRDNGPASPGAPVRPDVLSERNNFAVAKPAIVEKNGPLWLYDGSKLFGFPIVSNAVTLVSDQEVLIRKLDFLLPGRNGGHWRLGDNRIQKWTGSRLDLDLGPYPWANRVMTACEDNEGNLIVGTRDDGLFWFHGPGKVTHLADTNGLSHNTVLSLCMDREGVLWVGTDGGGLNSVRRRQFHILKDSLTIQSVCDDRQGGVWFAHNEGKLYHASREGLAEYGDNEGLPAAAVLRSVFVDRGSNVWVGTGRGLFRKEREKFLWIPGQPVSVLHEDRAGQIWVGSQDGLRCWNGTNWTTLDARHGLSANNVQALADDPEGNLWIGTIGGGLNCLRDGKFTVFKKGGGLPSDTISALCVDQDGVLWVGTAGGGLARHFRNQWTTYTTSEGLSGNTISYLIEDNDGYLWIGSNAGLMRIAKKALNDFAEGRAESVWCRAYMKSDGLVTHVCSQGSQPATCRSSDGRLWFATIRGLVSVNPAGLKPNAFQPPVVIESVTVQGREQMTNELCPGSLRTVIVPPGKELIEIRYTSLNLAGADRARFRYQLAGHETGWTDARERRIAPFSNLPPGQYEFHVTACNEDGVWNKSGARLAIVVLPPFWRTWWFVTANALLLLAIIISVVRYVSTQKLQRQLALLRQQEALEKERARIARDLHDQLGANLTQVALLGEMAESDKNLPEEVESHAQQICQTARETTEALDEIVWAANPANDTLESLVTYSLKYAQDYLTLAGIGYRLDAPAQLSGGVIAPEVRHNVFLAFKEAVNNVVKHAQAKSVWIRLRLDPNRFTLEIEDNGRGLANPEGKPGRNGLRNMRKRLEDAGGRFEIGPAAGQGTVVRLTAPFEKR